MNRNLDPNYSKYQEDWPNSVSPISKNPPPRLRSPHGSSHDTHSEQQR